MGRPGDYAYYKHPVLLLPSGPDKIWALQPRRSESLNTIALIFRFVCVIPLQFSTRKADN